MLALSRREGERILIGDDIVIEIHKIRNNRVVVTVSAPDAIVIDREEVRHTKKVNPIRKSNGKKQRLSLKEIVRELDLSYSRQAGGYESVTLPEEPICAMTH